MAQCLELITNSFYLLIFFIFWLTSNGYFRWQHDLRVGAVNLKSKNLFDLVNFVNKFINKFFFQSNISFSVLCIHLYLGESVLDYFRINFIFS